MYELNIGPMTKNIVDGVISFVSNTSILVCLIASRRQIDYTGGYVNQWTTKEFVKYVKDINPNVLVCRDHGGIGQGRVYDDGIESLKEDAACMDIIHIDPWKKLDLEESIDYTVKVIEMCCAISTLCYFEIGTEEAIFPMTADMLDYVLNSLYVKLPEYFHRIQYAVIQSGTSLKNGINTGEYDETRLIDMIRVCRKHGVLSKEHNGDYLPPDRIKHKFGLGLDSINIAPEVAHIETQIILDKMGEFEVNKWFELCISDGQWAKWFSKEFDPMSDKHKVLRLCGHYVLSHPEFNELFDLASISYEVYCKLGEFIAERIYYGY